MKTIFLSWLKRWTNPGESEGKTQNLDLEPSSSKENAAYWRDDLEMAMDEEDKSSETPLSYPSAHYQANRQIPAEKKMDTSLYRALSG